MSLKQIGRPEKADDIFAWMPPFLCYAMYRNKAINRRSRPNAETLAKATGLSSRTISRIASKVSWDSVRWKDIRAFTNACGIDLLRQRDERNYLKRTIHYKRPMRHLDDAQLRWFDRKCAEWRAFRTTLLTSP